MTDSAMVEVKTVDLIGLALDWAVAKSVPQKHWPVIVGGKVMLDTDYDHLPYSPSTRWQDGGPLIESEEIAIGPCSYDWKGVCVLWRASVEEGRAYFEHTNLLVAAMRAVVYSNLGSTITVPKELMQ